MMTAKEAREVEDRQTRANAFCEELNKQIVERANKMDNALENVVVPIDIVAYVCRILKDNGYEVRRDTRVEITVMW